MFFGVCKGLAEYSQIDVIWIRIAAIVAFMLTGFWPIFVLYIVAAIFLKPAPVVELKTSEDWSFYHNYTSDRKMALSNLKRRCEDLDRRTRRVESVVTDREYDWDRRFQSGT